MSILGLSGDTPSEVAVGFRSGWLKTVKIALAGGGYIALLCYGIELLERQPREGFGLLEKWGPWPFVALVAIAFFGRFLSRLNDTVQVSFSSVVGQATRTADALTQLADQGGRQAEEVQRLAVYAAQEFPGVYGRFDKQDAVLKDLAAAVNCLHNRLPQNVGHEGSGDR